MPPKLSGLALEDIDAKVDAEGVVVELLMLLTLSAKLDFLGWGNGRAAFAALA